VSKLVDHSDVRLTMTYLVHTEQALDVGMKVGQSIARAAVAGMGDRVQAAATEPSPQDGETSGGVA
jgi:hypothetical protein